MLGWVVGDTHCLQHCGHKQSVVDAFFGHQFPRLRRIERAHQNLSETAVGGGHRWAQRTHMEQRHRVEVAVANAEVARGVEREQRRHLSVVRMHYALGQAGGSRGVHDVQQVVVERRNGWLSTWLMIDEAVELARK